MRYRGKRAMPRIETVVWCALIVPITLVIITLATVINCNAEGRVAIDKAERMPYHGIVIQENPSWPSESKGEMDVVRKLPIIRRTPKYDQNIGRL